MVGDIKPLTGLREPQKFSSTTGKLSIFSSNRGKDCSAKEERARPERAS